MADFSSSSGGLVSQDKIIGLVLAGGKSARMGLDGKDKFLIPLGEGQCLLDLVLHQLEQQQLSSIVINANGDLSRLKKFGYRLTQDRLKSQLSAELGGERRIAELWGPLAGIHAGMSWALEEKPDTTHLLTVAADTPYFPLNYANEMVLHANKNHAPAILLARSAGIFQPTFGLWPLSLFKQLETSLLDGVRKIRAFASEYLYEGVDFPPVKIAGQIIDPFFNVNQMSDLELVKNMQIKS